MSELKGVERLSATVLGGGVSETSTGKPQAFLSLEDDLKRVWVWNGSFNEGRARELTIEALKSAGFEGSLNDLAKGLGFKKDHKVSITIDDEWNEDKSKSYRKVRWVNVLNKGAQMMDEADALIKLKGMGLDADFASMFGSGTKSSQPAFTADDIPF